MYNNSIFESLTEELDRVFSMDEEFDAPDPGKPYQKMFSLLQHRNRISRGQLYRIIRYGLDDERESPEDGTSWLSGEVINYYLGLICSYANDAAGCPAFAEDEAPLLYTPLNSLFLGTLTRTGIKSDRISVILKRYNLNGPKILEAEHIFIPIHVKESHWALMVISPKIRMIAFMDSWASSKKDYYYMSDRMIQPVIDLLQYHGGNKFKQSDWSFYKRRVPKQNTVCDCGVFTLAFAQSIAFGTDLKDINRKSRVQNRTFIASTILRGGFRDEGAPGIINVVKVGNRNAYKVTDYRKGNGYSIKLENYTTSFPDIVPLGLIPENGTEADDKKKEKAGSSINTPIKLESGSEDEKEKNDKKLGTSKKSPIDLVSDSEPQKTTPEPKKGATIKNPLLTPGPEASTTREDEGKQRSRKRRRFSDLLTRR